MTKGLWLSQSTKNPNLSFYNPKSSVHWVLPHDMVNPAAARSPPTHWKRFLGEQRMTVIYLILRKCIVIKQFFPKTFVVRIYHESCVLSAVIYLHDVPTLFFSYLLFYTKFMLLQHYGLNLWIFFIKYEVFLPSKSFKINCINVLL